MTSSAGKRVPTTHILSNISGTKGNQTIKSDQLIEYNMIYNFLGKLHKNCGEEIVPDPVLKN